MTRILHMRAITRQFSITLFKLINYNYDINLSYKFHKILASAYDAIFHIIYIYKGHSYFEIIDLHSFSNSSKTLMIWTYDMSFIKTCKYFTHESTYDAILNIYNDWKKDNWLTLMFELVQDIAGINFWIKLVNNCTRESSNKTWRMYERTIVGFFCVPRSITCSLGTILMHASPILFLLGNNRHQNNEQHCHDKISLVLGHSSFNIFRNIPIYTKRLRSDMKILIMG